MSTSPKAKSKQLPLILGAVVALLVVGVGAGVALWPDEPPPLDEAVDSDTGMTRDDTEDFMRTIGYVQ